MDESKLDVNQEDAITIVAVVIVMVTFVVDSLDAVNIVLLLMLLKIRGGFSNIFKRTNRSSNRATKLLWHLLLFEFLSLCFNELFGVKCKVTLN